jgi:hypothetical protein
MPTFIIGQYRVPGVKDPVVVESPLIGIANRDYENLYRELKKLHPKLVPGEATRLSSKIETREDVSQFLNPYPGMTLRQMFIDSPTADGTGAETSRQIGTVFFEGASQDVTLRYLQDKGVVGVTLIDRMTHNATRFSNQINAGIPIEQLPKLITEILGRDCKDLKVRLKVHPIPVPPGGLPKKPASVVLAEKMAKAFVPPEKIPAAKVPKTPPAPVTPEKNPPAK